MKYHLEHKLKLANVRKKTYAERIRDYIQGGKPGTDAQNTILGSDSKLSKSIDSGLDELIRPAAMAGQATVNPLLEAPANILLGRKADYGKYRGSRLRPAPATGGGVLMDYKPIDAETAQKIRAGDLPGKVTSVFYNTPLGRKEQFMARKTNYGGLVGFAQRRPLLTTGLGLASYALMSSPTLRQLVGSLLPGSPQAKISPAVLKDFSEQPNTSDPFASGAWK